MNDIDIINYLRASEKYFCFDPEHQDYRDAIQIYPINFSGIRRFCDSIGYIELKAEDIVLYTMESPDWNFSSDFVSVANEQLERIKNLLPGKAQFFVKDSCVTTNIKFNANTPNEVFNKITLFLQAVSNIILIFENERAIDKAKNELASLGQTQNSFGVVL